MFNRSAYVNRLQLKQWLVIFDNVGFKCELREVLTSKVASKVALDHSGVCVDPTYRVTATLT